MFVFKVFQGPSDIEKFKKNMREDTYEMIYNFSHIKLGLYAEIKGNLINIKNVTEEYNRGGPIYMHFYGVIVKLLSKHCLFGVICPEILYTTITIFLWFVTDKCFSFIATLIWIFIYVSSFNSIRGIHKKLIFWMR